MSTLSENLRTAREKMGLTKRKMAELVNVSESSYGKYEKGKENNGNEPPIDTLVQIARVLHTSIDALVGHAADPLPKLERWIKYLEAYGHTVTRDGDSLHVQFGKKSNDIAQFKDGRELVALLDTIEQNTRKELGGLLHVNIISGLHSKFVHDNSETMSIEATMESAKYLSSLILQSMNIPLQSTNIPHGIKVTPDFSYKPPEKNGE